MDRSKSCATGNGRYLKAPEHVVVGIGLGERDSAVSELVASAPARHASWGTESGDRCAGGWEHGYAGIFHQAM